MRQLIALTAIAISWRSSPSKVAAFSIAADGLSATSYVDVRETSPRNIKSFQEWAKDLGVETCDGFRLVSDPVDEQDWSVATSKTLSTNDQVVLVPYSLLLSSAQVTPQEQAEQLLLDESDRPLFRLYLNLLLQYELGDSSIHFHWLNSLPRRFYNGVAMTSACFECLPPYVRYLSEKERDTCQLFQRAIATTQGLVSETTVQNTDLLKWVYCVAVTRSFEVNTADGSLVRVIAPMGDMFNHGSHNHEVELTFDQDGNCIVYASRNISPGTPLRICYGDPTNPSLFLAKYGFVDQSSPASFCKLMHLQEEMDDLGLSFNQLLFSRESGDISPEVWDLLLWAILKAGGSQDKTGFYEAYMHGDMETKNLYHQHYFDYTRQALYDHVDATLQQLEGLSDFAKTQDIAKHPRLSLIQQHNDFTTKTFLNVKANLDAMLKGNDEYCGMLSP